MEFARAQKKGQLGSPKVFVELKCRPQDIHPDLVGLACLLTVEPFTASEITLSQPVSPFFARAFQDHFNKRIGPTDDSITPRVTPESGREGVAFSGGVDSCAALSVMPRDSVPIFLDRATDGQRRTMYRQDAALASCRAVASCGYDVHVVRSNLEYGRRPIGFPVDWSNSVPAVLHADHLSLRSIAFGTVLESAYRLGSNAYSDLKSRKFFGAWAAIFEAVGLPICLPVAGLSEVLTAQLALTAEVQAWMPQSCVRGEPGNPCGSCFKCFRKTILENAIRGRRTPDKHYELFVTSKEVQKKLLGLPIHHEIVLAYSLHTAGRSSNPVNRRFA